MAGAVPEEQEEAAAEKEGNEIAALEWLGGRHVLGRDDAGWEGVLIESGVQQRHQRCIKWARGHTRSERKETDSQVEGEQCR